MDTIKTSTPKTSTKSAPKRLEPALLSQFACAASIKDASALPSCAPWLQPFQRAFSLLSKLRKSNTPGERGFFRKGQLGFTLFEVLIVVALMAGLISVAIPFFRPRKASIKDVTREISLLARQIRHQARIKNTTYRLAFELGEGKNSYWVEASSGPVMIKSEETLKKEESLSEEDRPKSPFQRVEKPLKKPKTLPNGLSFREVEVKGRKDPTIAGMAYIHFSGQGLVEESLVQITDGKNLTWTLIFNPLTGHSEIIEKALSLKDIQRE